MSIHISRRQAIAAGAALTMSSRVRPASAQAEGTPQATPASPLPPDLPNGGTRADGSWAFTDDLGVTVTTEAIPTRVDSHIGMAAALFDTGYEVIGYYNPAEDVDGNRLPIAGDLPLDRLTSIGGFDEVDLELLFSLNADLFIGQNYGVETGGMWPFSEDVLAQIEQIVPVLSFAYGDDVTVVRNIESLENLASSLGADIEAAGIVAARDAFESASQKLEAAIAAKPNLKTLFLSGSNTGFWVESAGGADTRYFRSLGMSIFPELASGEVSWEQFLEYDADLIFVDDRTPNWWSPEQLDAEVPVWKSHPAVIAGQVAPWRAQFISSFKGFAPVLDEVADWIQKADDSIF